MGSIGSCAEIIWRQNLIKSSHTDKINYRENLFSFQALCPARRHEGSKGLALFSQRKQIPLCALTREGLSWLPKLWVHCLSNFALILYISANAFCSFGNFLYLYSLVDLKDSWGQRCSQQWTLEFHKRSSPRLPELIEVGFQNAPKSLQIHQVFLGIGTWAHFSSEFFIHFDIFHVFYISGFYWTLSEEKRVSDMFLLLTLPCQHRVGVCFTSRFL